MKTSLSLITLAILSNASFANEIAATELPKGHSVTQGTATIATDTNAMTINQTTDRVSINWDSFNIGKQASVTFQQPASSSIAYNRVTGANVSTIQGKLNANGRVFLANPNGVIFTKDAQVNVGAILATTKEVEKLGDNVTQLTFNGKSTSPQTEAEIRNDGQIEAEEAIYLVGNKVTNNGTLRVTGNPEEMITVKKNNWTQKLEGIEIATKNKTVLLAAGDRFTFDLDKFSIELTGDQVAGLIENNGAIISNDRILLTAKGEDTLKYAAVNNAGLLEANNITIEGGKIVLTEKSDIRYGKDSRNEATLSITQVGKDTAKGGGKIAGKITALAETEKVKKAVSTHNDRFKEGKFALDENGKVLFTADKTTVSSERAIETEEGLQVEGQLYGLYEKGGILLQAEKGNYKPYKLQRDNQNFVDVYQVAPIGEVILKIRFTKEKGKYTEVSITETKENLDPLNTRIGEVVKAKIEAKDYSVLDDKKLVELIAPIVEEEKKSLIEKLQISEEQLSRLSGPQIASDGMATDSLAKGNVDAVFEELKTKNASVTEGDVTFLATLIRHSRQIHNYQDSDRSVPTESKYQKEGASNEEIHPFKVQNALSQWKKLHKTERLPLTTLTAEAGIEVEKANFTHKEGSQHNVVILANNSDANTALNIRIADTQIDLGGGSFGIGSNSKFKHVQEIATLEREENGKKIPLYSIQYGRSNLQEKTIKELLQQVKFGNSDTQSLTSNGEQMTPTQLWDKFVASSTVEALNATRQEWEGKSFKDVVKPEFEKYIETYKKDNDTSWTTFQSASMALFDKSKLKNGSGSSTKDLTSTIDTTKRQTASVAATPYAPFNVALDKVNFTQSKDFVIADGFKAVTLNKVNTEGDMGLYINAGNQRKYTTTAKAVASGYEYVIVDLKERVMRGSTSVHNKRYHFQDYQLGLNRYPLPTGTDAERYAGKRELSTGFADWVTGLDSTSRSHIEGTAISIRDSQLNSRDGFMHLLAENVQIDNSRLAVNYAKSLADDLFMQQASKIGINGKNISLNQSSLFVKGEDVEESSAFPGAAGIFLMGNVVGQGDSKIDAKTYQGYTVRVGGNSTLKDLLVMATNTSPYVANGTDIGSNDATKYVSSVAFHIDDSVQRNNAGNVQISGKTTLDGNTKLYAYAPNGARAFESYGDSSETLPNINVTERAEFHSYERPRQLAQSANVVTGTGKISRDSQREMLRSLDHNRGIKATDLGLQQDNSVDSRFSSNITESVVELSPTTENIQVELCEEGGKGCKELPTINSEVSVGELL